MSEALMAELREMIFATCNVEDVDPDELGPDDPLTGPDSMLGLDSIDAVEIVVEVQKKYDVRIGGKEISREILTSLRTLADFLIGEGVTAS
ncbi:phosphopantetheine-binding protein [Desulfuromonas carbonis]|uniref:phosphopantetheine-binding protein n=1 Tax=Desulfuromonas sp. DDH964 TaxID=1823759 RepID=UPI00078C4525|nr:phosphopantetheine-binding protein [Desulfuromonas sp. DDH964]AMV72143.1 acyl carrier protein [Desulfuromonas sp. DDH964]